MHVSFGKIRENIKKRETRLLISFSPGGFGKFCLKVFYETFWKKGGGQKAWEQHQPQPPQKLFLCLRIRQSGSQTPPSFCDICCIIALTPSNCRWCNLYLMCFCLTHLSWHCSNARPKKKYHSESQWEEMKVEPPGRCSLFPPLSHTQKKQSVLYHSTCYLPGNLLRYCWVDY